jgi:hypothetical protein
MKLETWKGRIRHFVDHGGFYEMEVTGRGSSLKVLFGKTDYYHWICIPNYDVGCDMAEWSNHFWNYEKLSGLIGTIDAVTVTEALKAAQYLI